MHFESRNLEAVYIFLLIHKESNRILEGNRLAKNYYFSDDEPPQLADIFENIETIRNPLNNMEEEESIRLYGVPSIKGTGERFTCDIELCYTDKAENLVLLVIKDRVMDQNHELMEVVELMDNPVLVLGAEDQFKIHYGNYKFYQSMRQTKEGFQEKYQNSFSKFLGKEVAFSQRIKQQLGEKSECYVDIELSYGRDYYHLFYYTAFLSKFDGRLYGVLVRIRNQSDLMKKIEYDQQYIDIIQEFSKDLLFRVDIQKRTLVHRGDVSYFQGLYSEMEGYPGCMAETKLIHPEDVDGYLAFANRMIHGQGASYEARLLLKSGVYEKFSFQGKPIFDTMGKNVQIVGRMENIQKYVEIEKRASYDSLTATLDKNSFQDLVGNILDRAVQKDKYALLLLDFEDFSEINQSMGEDFGDFLLEVAGRRVINSTRNMDKVGRLAGAKFLVFFHHVPNQAAVMERANAILHTLRREFHNGAKRCSLQTSVGVALYPDHGTNYCELFEKAEKALCRAHYLGADMASMYTEELE